MDGPADAHLPVGPRPRETAGSHARLIVQPIYIALQHGVAYVAVHNNSETSFRIGRRIADMNSFEQAGEAMMLAEEGKAQIARAIVASIRRGIAIVHEWLVEMPTSLPPTESIRR